ncbi:MAG TPA: extracellular solute-binding protein [Thermomicrobiales bacterium]|nr:extracellular solute-binding protein [Thermomicrobiales bacterium]
MNQPGKNQVERLMEMEPASVMSAFRSGRISRRDLSKLFAALGLTSALGPAIGRNPALAQSSELTMIIWEGYTSDSFTIPWEEANDANVEATFAGTGDEMFAAMQGSGGTTYDMVSASSDLPQRLYDAGLLMEIDASKLTNYPDLYEQFQRPPYITFDDKLYGVNFAWGPTILLYNPDEVAETPTSWNALLDEQYSGKLITWNYPLQIAQYALLLDPKPEDPFMLDDEQLAQVKDILVRQRPLVRKYWDLGGEVAELFLNGEAVIGDGWSWITLQIQDSDGTVAEATPEEGVTGWSDSWCISNKAADPELALKWADYMIGPEGQMGVIENLNYSITNSKVVETLPTELREQLRMVDVPAEYAKIHMWKFVPNYDKWVQIWQEATAS